MAVKVCCWHALHLAFFLCSLLSWLFSRLKSAFLLSPPPKLPQKLPSHIAIVIDSEDVNRNKCKITSLLRFLVQSGLQRASLYDVEGTLKSLIPDLVDAFEKDSTVKFYVHNVVKPPFKFTGETRETCFTELSDGSSQDIHESFTSQKTGRLVVEVLSLCDGKATIVEAARHLCLKALESDAQADLKEDDVNTSLREIGGAGPDPDLLLLFSTSRCLSGFPPWRLRLTEIQHMGSIQKMTERSIVQALHEFACKQHRYGK